MRHIYTIIITALLITVQNISTAETRYADRLAPQDTISEIMDTDNELVEEDTLNATIDPQDSESEIGTTFKVLFIALALITIVGGVLLTLRFWKRMKDKSHKPTADNF